MAGCSSLLPRGKTENTTRWDSFAAMMADYERVVPYDTSVEDLKQLGFHPDSNPNVVILSNVEITERFLNSSVLRREDIAPGLLECVDAGERCRGYELAQEQISNRRLGNFWLDFLNFRREVETKGWRFKAVIVSRNGTVTYKVWSGQPNVLALDKEVNPLGPLQGAGSGAAKSVMLD